MHRAGRCMDRQHVLDQSKGSSTRQRKDRMNPVVAVIAPGMMGSAVGGRLVETGLKVLTSLTGRSADPVARTKNYGLTSASDEEIAATDFILSILPPGDAVA